MSLLLLMDDAFSPRSLFAAGEQGAWYDPFDFSTMFQDAAGTTTVTALGQPVGLELDKRLGLALGAELVTNGDMSSSTGWTLGAGFAIGGGKLTATDVAAGQAARQFVVQANKSYRVSLTVESITGIVRAQLGSNASAAGRYDISTAGQHSFFLHNDATNNPTFLQLFVAAGTLTGVFDNFSAKEIAGNHAYQTTAASRPTVQSGYNAFDKTDDHLLVAAGGAGTTGFLLACGIVVPAAGTARTIFSDRGTNAGYSLSIDTANKLVFSGGTGAAFTTLTSAAALTTGQKYAVIAWHDGTNLNLSINNVAETPVACGTVTAGTASFTIGKNNGSASGYWGDRLYSMVYRKNDTSNAGNRSNLFSYLVGKMGGL